MRTKEIVYIRNEFNSHRICLEHQNGHRDIMWKCSIDLAKAKVKLLWEHLRNAFLGEVFWAWYHFNDIIHQGRTKQKHATSDWTPEPAIQSCDTGQQIPYFDSCQLIITWMPNIRLNTTFLCLGKYNVSYPLTWKGLMHIDNFVRTKMFCALLHTLHTCESSATVQ